MAYESFYEDPIDFFVDVVFDAASPVTTLLGGAFRVDARPLSSNKTTVTGTATYVSPTRMRCQFPAKALLPDVWDIQPRVTPLGYNPQVVKSIQWTVKRSAYVS